MNIENKKYIEKKKKRREIKKKTKRNATGEEVLFIFEKILTGWKTIRIYNTIIQNNPNSEVLKKNVENISTGNCKVYESELSPEKYKKYKELRKKVYELHKKDNKIEENIKDILMKNSEEENSQEENSQENSKY
jgi:hypothetical protein